METTLCSDVESTRTRPIPPDLRECQREFCELWGCERVHYPMPCFYCPIMRDVQRMQREIQAAPVRMAGGPLMQALHSDVFSGFGNQISLKFRLFFEQGKEPFTDWTDGSIRSIDQTGLTFSAKLSEENIEILTERYVLISLQMKLPRSCAIITSEARLTYFQKGFQSQEGTLVDLGVELKGFADDEKSDISQFLREGGSCWQSRDNGTPSLFPESEN
jgi:hypothetical protein